MAKLHIIRGISGSGKSTFAATLGCPVFEADAYHISDGKYNWQAANVKSAHTWCGSVTFDALSQGITCAVANTFLEYWEIKPYIDFCVDNGHSYEIYTMEGDYGSIHNVPEATMDAQRSRIVTHDLIVATAEVSTGAGNGKALFTKRQSKRYPELSVLKYTRDVFYKSLWDDNLIEMRGRVVDAEGNTVVNPLTKVFNRNERRTDIALDEECLFVSKINGFMGCLTAYKGEVLCSTTGSLDSDYCDMLREYVTPKITEVVLRNQGISFLFEVCHPNDPHIVKESEGLWLLGMRKVDNLEPYFSNEATEDYLTVIAKEMDVKRPSYGVTDFANIVLMAKQTFREGFMVYGQTSGTVLKIKSPYYLTAKLLARVSPAKFDSVTRRDVPEEFYDLLDYIKSYQGFCALNEQERLVVVKEFIWATYKT